MCSPVTTGWTEVELASLPTRELLLLPHQEPRVGVAWCVGMGVCGDGGGGAGAGEGKVMYWLKMLDKGVKTIEGAVFY